MRIYRKLLVLVAGCLYFSGLVPCIRWARGRGRHVVILNYHRAAIGDLHAHLRYLRRYYRIVPLDDALEELYATPPSEDISGAGQTAVPRARGYADRRAPLVITFDDGYFDNYSHAAALAAKLGVPITLFLVHGYLETRQRFWWYEAEALVRDARVKEVTIEKRTYSLVLPADRRALSQWIDSQVRFAGAFTTREAFIATMREALDVPSGSAGDDPESLPFGWDEARELLANPFVTYGAHTMHHPILACLSDAAEVRDEISLCRVVLEQGLGRGVTAFAYPVGKRDDIDERAVQAVRAAHYRWAVTTIPGYNTPSTDPHLLRRISTDPDVPILVLAAQATGIWHLFALSRLRRLLKPTGIRRAARR